MAETKKELSENVVSSCEKEETVLPEKKCENDSNDDSEHEGSNNEYPADDKISVLEKTRIDVLKQYIRKEIEADQQRWVTFSDGEDSDGYEYKPAKTSSVVGEESDTEYEDEMQVVARPPLHRGKSSKVSSSRLPKSYQVNDKDPGKRSPPRSTKQRDLETPRKRGKAVKKRTSETGGEKLFFV